MEENCAGYLMVAFRPETDPLRFGFDPLFLKQLLGTLTVLAFTITLAEMPSLPWPDSG